MNSDKKVSVYDNTVSAREYISYIAESAGCFACIGRDGKLYFRSMFENETEIPLELFAEYKWGEEFKVSKISYEDGIRSFKFGDNTRNNIWINQDNMYIVDKDQVQKIFNKLNGTIINSFEGRTIIDPAVDIGDKLIIDGKPVIYQGEMTLEGRFIADIKSIIQIKQKEETTVKKESQKNINRRVQSSIDQVEGKISQLVQETSENSQKLTKHEQDINGMKDTVSNIEDLTRTITQNKVIELGNCIEGNLLELHIYGNNTVFDSLYVGDDVVVSDDLVIYGDSQIIVANKDGNEVQYELGIGEALRQNSETCDEFILEKGKAKVIRRVDKSGTTKVKEVIEDLGELEILLEDGDNTITIKNYFARMKAKFALKNDYTDIFATRVEMSSSIKQTAEEINLEVEKKVDENEVISKINQSAEQISIEADKISLNGKTLNLADNMEIKSNNFNVDKEGNMTCKKATCDDIVIKNSTIREGYIELKSTNGNSSFSVVDTQEERVNSELSANLVNFNSNLGRGVANMGIDMASGDGFISVTGVAECGNLVQTSRKERKKYIKRVNQNAIELINNTDICQYQLKGEKATGHRHYGVVIGEGYNCPQQVIAETGKGIEIYSMVTLAWKAIQELAEENKILKEKIERLEGK